ncbi:flagellar brake protein [Metapseudomonas resinovorans]|uniref:flagellar brake protein n=1 Tax=Metapseudomonas resinovorans TaxID=53412 RepID=UPI00041769A1|nr:flagellar brake protein [Pseudomonas resinovorans]
MSNPFHEENGPQPPKVLKAQVEILANLRLLQQHHDPLIITFHDRNQRFQSYLVDVDRDRGLIALDELIPNDGERFLKNGETFRVESFHEGVRIAWETQQPATVGEFEGDRCYWCALPDEVTYHQRRNAFRAPLKQSQLVPVELDGDKMSSPVKGVMLDISATGCKLRFEGDLNGRLQPGQVYERFSAKMPIGPVTTPVELRHLHFDEKLGMSFVGIRFHKMSGLVQRNVERFVYQLQREARRFEKDELF